MIKDVLIIGDLHLSDRHRGRHKDYLKVCLEYMLVILDVVKKERPSAIVFLGDIVGVREKTIKNRLFLLEVINWFRTLNEYADVVFSVKGNHDMSETAEFDFLTGLGCFKTTNDMKYLDVYGKDGLVEGRFHFIDYGNEKEPIELLKTASNVVLAHNNIKVAGKTTWYPDCVGYELNKMLNWSGIEMVIAGHIHNTSPYFVESQIEGKDVFLFYPGCGTRPVYDRNIYQSVNFIHFIHSDELNSLDYNVINVDLAPSDKVFFEDKDYVEDLTDEELTELVRREDLHDFVGDLVKYRIATGNPIEQLRAMPNTKVESVDIACKYIEMAYANLSTNK